MLLKLKEAEMMIIPGVPIAKQRARHRSCGNFVQTYDPQEKEKKIVKNFFKSSPAIKEADAYGVTFKFVMPYPKSFSEKQKNLHKWGLYDAPCNKDLDNLVKFYLDCANEVLFSDDRKIISIEALKTYSDDPKMMMEVMPMESFKAEEEAKEILSYFSPDEFNDLSSLLGMTVFYASYESRARVISKLADFYSQKLKKISQKHPKYWEKESYDSP